METAAVVRAARERAGLTQRNLAQLCRTSQSAIARYESGQMIPTTEALGRLLKACGVDLESMLRRAPTDASRPHVRGGASIDLRSILDLATVDERVRRFTPLGLATSHMLRADAAVEFQQRVIADVVLAANVPAGTRAMFERLRQLYVYGCFQYEFFTVANDLAPLVLEAALGERFVSHYEGVIPMIDTTGRVETFAAADFKAVHDQVTGPEFRKRSKWKLKSRAGGRSMQFSANLTDLLGWARMERLLRGQRNRVVEPVLVRIRNRSAHASGPHLLMPPDAARTIRDLAEIINHLWGDNTPGGRLYPGALKREVMAIGWDENHTTTGLFRRDQLEMSDDRHDWTFIVVRGVPDDPELWHYDREFESTAYPTEYLWGPGRFEPAMAFLSEASPEDDNVLCLDRLFVVGEHQGSPEPPRRPEVFLSQLSHEPSRTWHLVRADFPVDAYAHVRNAIHQAQAADSKEGGDTPQGRDAGPAPCSQRPGPCPGCAAEVLAVGTGADVAAEVNGLGITYAEDPDGIRVPVPFRLWP